MKVLELRRGVRKLPLALCALTLGCGEATVEHGITLVEAAALDTEAPLVTIERPAPNSVLRPGSVSFAGSATDEGGLTGVELQIGDNEPQAVDGLESWTYTSPELASGVYTVTVRATDPSGNVGESEITLFLQTGAQDVEPPQVIVIDPVSGTVVGPGPFVVRGRASDDVEVAEVYARLTPSGGEVLARGSDPWEVVLDASSLAAGAVQVVVGARDAAGNEATEVTLSVEVDTSLPVAVLGALPDDPTRSADASITVAGPNVVTYAYQLDDEAESSQFPVTTPISLVDLPDGRRRLRVIGISATSVRQRFATEFEWVIDTTPPVALVSAPPSPTNQDSVSLNVSGTDVVEYRAALDGATLSSPVPVASPLEATGLVEGPHFFDVVGLDALGNEQVTSTRVSWVVDQTAPDPGVTTLSGTPSSVTVGADVNITVGGAGVVRYTYSLDGGALQGPFPVGTPLTLVGLSPGGHTLEVYGEDAAGNVQTTPNVVSWTIDPDAIVATVSAPPVVTNSDSVLLTVNGGGVVEYEYILIPPSGVPGARLGPTPVGTPIVIDTTLATPSEGIYTVQVFGVDDSGGAQPSASEVSFEVDRTPPVAELSGLPAPTTDQTTLNVTVSGDQVVTYIYQLDGGPILGPFPVAQPITAIGVQDGEHTLDVFGIDLAGNEQPSATSHTWTVSTVGPTAALNGVPPPTTTQTSVTITVSGDDVVEYRYRLDGGALTAATAISVPLELTGLAGGPHTLEVFAVDSMGVEQSVPTVVSWTVL